jgi:hypothetical protein
MRSKSILKDLQVLAAMYLPSWPEINARIAAAGVPVAHVATDDAQLKERLRQIEGALGESREELVVLRGAAATSKSAYVKDPSAAPSSAVFRTAQRDAEAVTECEERISSLTTEQVGVLKMGGWAENRRGRRDQNGPSGDYPAGDWQTAVQQIDLSRGIDRVDVPLTTLVGARPMAAGGGGLTVTPGAGGLMLPVNEQPFVPLPLDQRGLFAYLPGEQLDGTEPTIADYKMVSRSVEGEITRASTADTAKAEALFGIDLATDELLQFSLFLPGVAAKLFDYIEGLGEILSGEMGKLLVQRLNLHIIEQIEAAKPPTGEEGETLLEKLRHAVKEVKGAGGTPSLIALNPDDAADLDLSVTGTDKSLVFPARATGTSSPIWTCNVCEIPDLSKPLVIDPATCAKVFYGGARLKVDEGTELDRNLVRLELSFEAICNVRQIVGGAYVVDKAKGA